LVLLPLLGHLTLDRLGSNRSGGQIGGREGRTDSVRRISLVVRGAVDG